MLPLRPTSIISPNSARFFQSCAALLVTPLGSCKHVGNHQRGLAFCLWVAAVVRNIHTFSSPEPPPASPPYLPPPRLNRFPCHGENDPEIEQQNRSRDGQEGDQRLPKFAHDAGAGFARPR